jgi:hypothetical protein
MNRRSLAAVTVIAFALIGSAWATAAPTAKRVVVRVGESRTFTKAELRSGTTVSCSFGGHTLTVRPPSGSGTGGGALWPGTSAARFHLNISAKTGDGYVVRCGRGGSHWWTVPRELAL